MTSNHESSAPASEAKAERGVLCAKCEHLNPSGLLSCEFCGSRLFIKCRSCGQTNHRVAGRCTQCGHRMHRSWWRSKLRRVERKIFGRRPKITWFQIALLVVSVYAAYKVILMVVEYRPAGPP
jgi:hypothetical protein